MFFPFETPDFDVESQQYQIGLPDAMQKSEAKAARIIDASRRRILWLLLKR